MENIYDLIDTDDKRVECIMCSLRSIMMDNNGVHVCGIECYERYLGFADNYIKGE